MDLRTKSKPRQREQERERDVGKQLVLLPRDRVISSLGKVKHAPVEIQSHFLGEQETDAPVCR